MTNLFLLTNASNAAAFRAAARKFRSRSKKRDDVLCKARAAVYRLNNWVFAPDGFQYHRLARCARAASVPSRPLAQQMDDLFYDTPGAWFGSPREVLRTGTGYITVDAEKAAAAREFLRRYFRITRSRPSRTDGGIQFAFVPRKGIPLGYKRVENPLPLAA